VALIIESRTGAAPAKRHSGLGAGGGHQGEEPPPATLADVIRKYRTLRDRLWERREREGADFKLLPQAQLRWASSVLMDLERLDTG
jgi:hypothetical protein